MSSGLVVRAAAARLAACARLLVAAAVLAGCTAPSEPGGATALWNLVDAGCNRGGDPGPGLQCNPAHRDAVLKDRCGQTHYLLIPTVRRPGVESPELLRNDEPGWFADAWAARELVIAASGRREVAPDEVGLAINSRWGRSQGQLHIHIDFVRPEVREAIRQWVRQGGARPTVELLGHPYRIVHVAALQRPTPFQLAAGPDETPQQRERVTIGVVADGESGFYVLIGQADATRLDRGHAEEILVPRHCGD